MAKDLFGDLSSDSSAERSRYREKKSKINCGRGSKYRKPVKGRDRGAMTGKFYRAKNAGESSERKRQTEERTMQSAQTRRKGTERRKMPLGRKRRRKPDGKGRKKDFGGAGNGKTNEKSVNFMPERAKCMITIDMRQR